MDIYNIQKIPLKAIKTSPTRKYELNLVQKDLVVNKMPELPLTVDLDRAYMTYCERAETLKLDNASRFRKIS